uniref:Septin-type G domain-containing protein n=1 Tax=Amphiprion percula TaxID=161767 RepID=A0A3P8SKL1_AMPPE
MVKARLYPWGSVQVENENHCDFVKLREMLLRVNMEDLREQTHARHYELYRRCKLEEMGFKDTGPDSQSFSLQETYEAKRKEFLVELQRKEEEMRQMSFDFRFKIQKLKLNYKPFFLFMIKKEYTKLQKLNRFYFYLFLQLLCGKFQNVEEFSLTITDNKYYLKVGLLLFINTIQKDSC